MFTLSLSIAGKALMIFFCLGGLILFCSFITAEREVKLGELIGMGVSVILGSSIGYFLTTTYAENLLGGANSTASVFVALVIIMVIIMSLIFWLKAFLDSRS